MFSRPRLKFTIWTILSLAWFADSEQVTADTVYFANSRGIYCIPYQFDEKPVPILTWDKGLKIGGMEFPDRHNPTALHHLVGTKFLYVNAGEESGAKDAFMGVFDVSSKTFTNIIWNNQARPTYTAVKPELNSNDALIGFSVYWSNLSKKRLSLRRYSMSDGKLKEGIIDYGVLDTVHFPDQDMARPRGVAINTSEYGYQVWGTSPKFNLFRYNAAKTGSKKTKLSEVALDKVLTRMTNFQLAMYSYYRTVAGVQIDYDMVFQIDHDDGLVGLEIPRSTKPKVKRRVPLHKCISDNTASAIAVTKTHLYWCIDTEPIEIRRASLKLITGSPNVSDLGIESLTFSIAEGPLVISVTQ